MQLLGLGLIPFFMSTIFQYLFAALDAQKKFFVSTLLGSILRIILLVTLIPRYNFVGPAIAFVFAEIVTVGVWIYQLDKLGYSAHVARTLWRPLIVGTAMGVILYQFSSSPVIVQIEGAVVALLVYALGLLLLRTFSEEEIQHAREGIAFVSPFVASWAKKLRRDP